MSASQIRSVIFRTFAGLLAGGTLLVVAFLLAWGVQGVFPWSRLAPTILLQLLFTFVFGRYAIFGSESMSRTH